MYLCYGYAYGSHKDCLTYCALADVTVCLCLQVLGLLINQLSRRYEFQADNFAVKLGHAPELREALKKLDSNNKSAPNVDRWYSAYHYSHPPLLERLTAIDEASLKLRKRQ